MLARAEFEIRGAAQPRYHLEMALLRWVHLRKLVPLTELIADLEQGSPPTSSSGGLRRQVGPTLRGPAGRGPGPGRPPERANAGAADGATTRPGGDVTPARDVLATATGEGAGGLKDALLAEIKRTKKFFHGTVVAQARRIDMEGDRGHVHICRQSPDAASSARTEPILAGVGGEHDRWSQDLGRRRAE